MWSHLKHPTQEEAQVNDRTETAVINQITFFSICCCWCDSWNKKLAEKKKRLAISLCGLKRLQRRNDRVTYSNLCSSVSVRLTISLCGLKRLQCRNERVTYSNLCSHTALQPVSKELFAQLLELLFSTMMMDKLWQWAVLNKLTNLASQFGSNQ